MLSWTSAIALMQQNSWLTLLHLQTGQARRRGCSETIGPGERGGRQGCSWPSAAAQLCLFDEGSDPARQTGAHLLGLEERQEGFPFVLMP